MDCVAVRGLLDVVVAHRVGARGFVEQQVHEVVAVEIGHPHGRIVHSAIRLRDGVVVEVGELAEDGPDCTFAFAGQLDILAARHLGDLPIGVAFAVEPGLQRLLFQLFLLIAQRICPVVAPLAANLLWLVDWRGGNCRNGACRQEGDKQKHGKQNAFHIHNSFPWLIDIEIPRLSDRNIICLK